MRDDRSGWEMMRKLLVMALVLGWGAGAVSAAEQAAPKIAFVNVVKVFDGYERTKQSDAALEKKGQQKEAELEGKMGELKKMREGLELLNDASREGKARELEARADELKRFRANTVEDLRRERNAAAQEIIKDIQKAVEDYAKANGYTLILDQRAVLYGADAHEISDAVLQHLNSRSKKP